MKVQVQDLGKLRREMQIEIPFDEIRGEYQQVKDQLILYLLIFPSDLIERNFNLHFATQFSEILNLNFHRNLQRHGTRNDYLFGSIMNRFATDA